MRITNPTITCKLIDIETHESVGTCKPIAEKDKLTLIVKPTLQGYEDKSIRYVVSTDRPYLLYKDANMVEIHGIKKAMEETYDGLQKVSKSQNVSKIKIYITITGTVRMKKQSSLKETYDSYIQTEAKLKELKKHNSWDIELYKNLTKKRDELRKTLHENNLL